jgi:large subunit ribosomal protein L29
MYKAKELRNESKEELELKLVTLRKEIYDLRAESERKAEKPHLISQKRKEIARILTVRREKELAGK